MRDLNDLTRPTVPSGAIQERMRAETEERRGVVGPAPALPDDAGAPIALRTALGQAVAELAPQIVELSHDIHDHPETGYEEHHAVATVAELLRRHGIEPEVGVYGMDTALRAEIPGAAGADAEAEGSGESAGTIAILAEYDALPGIGLLRQQILPMDRLHAVVVDGGRVPNVVPERSELNIFVRSKYPETLKDLVGRVEDVLRGAALMTGTGLEIITPPCTRARWSGRPGAPPETRRPWTARTAWRPSPWTGCTTAVSVGLCEPISRPAAPSTSSTSGRSDARPQPLLLERSAGPRHVQ